jgi:hypothetical protein
VHFCIVSWICIFVVNTDGNARRACEVRFCKGLRGGRRDGADSPLVLTLGVWLGSRGIYIYIYIYQQYNFYSFLTRNLGTTSCLIQNSAARGLALNDLNRSLPTV